MIFAQVSSSEIQKMYYWRNRMFQRTSSSNSISPWTLPNAPLKQWLPRLGDFQEWILQTKSDLRSCRYSAPACFRTRPSQNTLNHFHFGRIYFPKFLNHPWFGGEDSIWSRKKQKVPEFSGIFHSQIKEFSITLFLFIGLLELQSSYFVKSRSWQPEISLYSNFWKTHT